VKLLEVVETMGLEGVISKRRASPYLSGTRCG
jgi:ATP-dependent DNA ligase